MAAGARWWMCLCVTIAAAAAAAAEDAPGYMKPFSDEELARPHVSARGLPMPDAFVDGSWGSIVAASDGRTYFTVASHSPEHNGQFYCYDPVQDRIARVSDLGEWPEPDPERASAGVASGIFEAGGVLYMAACPVLRAAENSPVRGWFLSYDLKTGRRERLAPLPPNRGGRPTVLLEPVLRRLYVLLNGRQVLAFCDLATRQVTVVGSIEDDPDICPTLIADERGTVLGSTWGGVIFRYDPAARQMGCLLTRLPSDPNAPQPRQDASSLAWRATRWGPMLWDAQSRWFYGVRANDEYLFRLRAPEPAGHRAQVEGMAQIGFRPSDVQPRYAGLGLALRGRTLYYCSYPLWQPEAHLVACDLETLKVRDLGPIVADGRRRVSEIHSLAVGSDALLHAVAMVWSLEGQDPANGWAVRADCYYHARLLKIDPDRDFQNE